MKNAIKALLFLFILSGVFKIPVVFAQTNLEKAAINYIIQEFDSCSLSTETNRLGASTINRFGHIEEFVKVMQGNLKGQWMLRLDSVFDESQLDSLESKLRIQRILVLEKNIYKNQKAFYHPNNSCPEFGNAAISISYPIIQEGNNGIVYALIWENSDEFNKSYTAYHILRKKGRKWKSVSKVWLNHWNWE